MLRAQGRCASPWLADKLFNARAMLRDYLTVRDKLWARFNEGRDGQLWYYRALADAFARLAPQPGNSARSSTNLSGM